MNTCTIAPEFQCSVAPAPIPVDSTLARYVALSENKSLTMAEVLDTLYDAEMYPKIRWILRDLTNGYSSPSQTVSAIRTYIHEADARIASVTVVRRLQHNGDVLLVFGDGTAQVGIGTRAERLSVEDTERTVRGWEAQIRIRLADKLAAADELRFRPRNARERLGLR